MGDLRGRVLPDERYRALWPDRCAAMHREPAARKKCAPPVVGWRRVGNAPYLPTPPTARRKRAPPVVGWRRVRNAPYLPTPLAARRKRAPPVVGWRRVRNAPYV